MAFAIVLMQPNELFLITIFFVFDKKARRLQFDRIRLLKNGSGDLDSAANAKASLTTTTTKAPNERLKPP